MGRTTEAIQWSVSDGIGTIRLAREHGNAINDDLVEGLLAGFQRAEEDPEVRGVLLTSSGKLFCPGLDLQELTVHDRPTMSRFLGRFSTCLLKMFNFPKPVVAALGGHALAGGCVLALTTDWRLLREGAMIGLNEVMVGVPLPYGVSQILHETVRTPHMEEVALRGGNYLDDEAVAAGLVHEVHRGEGLEERARQRLGELTSKDPRAYSITKRYLRSDTFERIQARDKLFQEEFLDCWFSDETRARIRSIVADLKAKKP